MLRRIRKGDKAVIVVELGFMETSYSPLARSFQAAAYALAAWELEFDVRLRCLFSVEGNSHLSRWEYQIGPPRIQWSVARHQRRIPPLFIVLGLFFL